MQRKLSYAQQLQEATSNLSAWSIDAFPAIRDAITKTSENQWGRVYEFSDGSRGMVRTGMACFYETRRNA